MLKTLGGAKRARILITLTAVCSMVLAMLAAGVSPVKADEPGAGNSATLSIQKDVDHAQVNQGGTLTYDIYVQCSSLTTDCKDVEVSDQIDTRFTNLVVDGQGGTVTKTNNKVVIKWDKLTDGSQKRVTIAATVDADADFANGEIVKNVASVSASNAATKTADVDTKIIVEHNLAVTGNISLSPNAVYAKAADANRKTTATFTVTNTSTKIVPVKELTIQNTNTEVYDYFNLATSGSAGTVTARPDGADQVVVAVLVGENWIIGAPQTGNALSLPAGVNAQDVRGISYTFKSSTGADIAKTSKVGKVELPLILRDNNRADNSEINPPAAFSKTMTVKPTISGKDVNGANDSKTGDTKSASIQVNPNIVNIGVTQRFFEPANANAPWTTSSDTTVFEGQTQNVTSIIEATNNSGFPINNLTIETPYDANTMGAFNAKKYRVVFPSGAKKAVVTIKCDDGNEHTINLTESTPAAGVDVPCAAGSKVVSGKVTFLSDDGQFQIANGSTGSFGFTGQLDGTQTVASSPVRAYYRVTSSNPVNAAGAYTKVGNAGITVVKPSVAINNVSKTANAGTIIPGQEISFTLSFRNNGNTPGTFVLVDPADPKNDPAPWDKLRITGVSNGSNNATIELFDPTADNGNGAYVAYSNNAALLERATGIRVTHANLNNGSTSTTTVKAMLRDGIDANTAGSIKNCMKVTVNGSDTSSSACVGGEGSNGLPVQPAAASAVLNKSFPVMSVDRPLPGLESSAQTVQTRLTARNDGPAFLRNFTLEDKGTHQAAGEPNFFDSVDFQGNTVKVNRMIGSTHAKIWVCDFATDCATWVEATGFVSLANNNTQNITIDKSGVSRVGGIKVQFATNSTGTGNPVITTATNNGTGDCAGATVCFDVKPRATLFSDSSTPIPNTINNGVTGQGETAQLPGMNHTTFDVAMAPASFQVVEGKPQLSLTKTPNGTVAPGGKHEFTLTFKNTGSAVVTNPKLVDNLPAELDWDATKPVAISYNHAVAGATDPSAPAFSTSPSTPGAKVEKMTWKWDNWKMMPGDEVVVKAQMILMPGTPGDITVTNKAGITGAEFISGDNGNTVPGIDKPCVSGKGLMEGESPTEVYCTDTANVKTQSGDAFSSAKWVTGNADLGFYNSATKSYVPLDDAACPKLVVDGKTYTRFPCTALVLPGQEYDYVLRLTNTGTNPVNQVRVIDGLPVSGDTGVILDQSRGTDWTNRPTLNSAVVPVSRDGMTSTIGYSNDLDACTASLTSADASGCSWSDSWSSSTGSFQVRLQFAEGKLLAPGDSVDVKLDMDTPYNVGDQDDLPIAWNSIAQNVWAVQPNGKVNELRPSEPNKVGVGMLHSSLEVKKIVVGESEVHDTTSPFPVAWKCSADDGAFSINGTGTITPGQTTTLTKAVFPGVECEIWETNPRTGTPSATEENPLRVTIPAFTYGTDQVPTSVGFGEITNTFTKVPAKLKITKAVEGTNAPKTADFNFDGDSGEFTLNGGDNNSKSITLDQIGGSFSAHEVWEDLDGDRWAGQTPVCTTQRGTQVSYDGGQFTLTNIKENDDITCAFTNTYTPVPVKVNVTKKVEGINSIERQPEGGFNFTATGSDGFQLLHGDEAKAFEVAIDDEGFEVAEGSELPTNWTFKHAICSSEMDDEQGRGGTVINIQGNVVNLSEFVEGDVVNCEFTNVYNPTPVKVNVTKQVSGEGASATQEFDFAATSEEEGFKLSAESEAKGFDVELGTEGFAISESLETMPNRWNLAGAVCTSELGSEMPVEGNVATLANLVEGDTVNCVFNNLYTPEEPEQPAVTPSDDPSDNPGDGSTPTDGTNTDDQGVLPHTGAGLTVMVALLALILIGGGLVLRYASRQRKH